MNTQEIQGLIDTKIKGQGTNVDAGSALPPILTALNENVGKAVSPDSTDMSEADQMQVRKNLGLYYETPEETNTVNGTDEGEIYEQPGGITYKYISDDTPSPSKIKAVIRGGEEVEYNINDTSLHQGFFTVEIGYNGVFLIIVSENQGFPEFPTGIYVATYPAESMEYSLEYITADAYVEKIPERFLPETGTSDAVQYVPQELTEAQKMQARKNQDLYYSEGGETTTPEYDSQEVLDGGVGGLFKVNSDTPLKDEVSGVILNGGTPEALSNFTVSEYDWGYIIGVPYFSLLYVVLTEYQSGFNTFDAGIYIQTSTYPDFKQQLVYGEPETVHQIPAKYIPDMPSGGGAFFVKATYSYPNYTLDKTYAEVLQAIEDGQVVILDLSLVAGASDYFLCARNATTQGAANGISFAGITNGIVRGFKLNTDDTFVEDYVYAPTAEIEFQHQDNIIDDGGCGLVEINSTSPVKITPTIIGNERNYANGTWSVKRISGSAVFAMTGIGSQFSITASETGVSQAIVSCEYTSSSIVGTFTYRLSAIITAVATI